MPRCYSTWQVTTRQDVVWIWYGVVRQVKEKGTL
jgi:hypothetical protein